MRSFIKYLMFCNNIKFIILNDGCSSSIEDINDFISSNDNDEEVLKAVVKLLTTGTQQSVGMGFTIKLYL